MSDKRRPATFSFRSVLWALLTISGPMMLACGGTEAVEGDEGTETQALRVSSDTSDAERWILQLQGMEDDRVLARLDWNVRAGHGEVVVDGDDASMSMQAQGVGVTELESGLIELWRVRARGTRPESGDGMALPSTVEAREGIVTSAQGLHRPIGNFDTIYLGTGTGLTKYYQGRRAAGWSFDWDNPAASIWVHFYLNSVYRGAAYANQVRTDVNQVYGVPGNHGFLWTFNVSTLTEVVPYGIDLGSDGNPPLGMRLAGCRLWYSRWYCY